jgi:hypothetical protein
MLRNALSVCALLICVSLYSGGVANSQDNPAPAAILLKAIKAEVEKLEKTDAGADQPKASIGKLQAAFDAFNKKPTNDELAAELDKLAADLAGRKYDGKLKAAVVGFEAALNTFKGDPDAAESTALAVRLAVGLARNPDEAGLKASIVTLADKIANYQGKGTSPFLQKQAELFISLLDATPGSLTANSADTAKVMDLPRKIAGTFRQTQPVETAKALAAALSAVVKAEAGYVPPLGDPEFATAINDLSDTLKAQVSNKFPIARFNAAAEEINAVVGEPAGTAGAEAKKLVETNREWLQNSPDSLAKAEAAMAALKTLQGGFRPMVHIIEATYGDTSSRADRSRHCDATLAMRNQCERLDKCELPTGYETSLCGFDPIPRADERIRGVEVRFGCFVGGDEVWDGLARTPLTSPTDSGDLSDPDHFESHLVILRGTGMTIRCPFEGSGLVIPK